MFLFHKISSFILSSQWALSPGDLIPAYLFYYFQIAISSADSSEFQT